MKQSTRFQARAIAAARDGDVKRANKLAKRSRLAAAKWDDKRG